MSEYIFKICTNDEWENAQSQGAYSGSSDDVRDGFIHFSTENQLPGTLEKHFKDKENLLILSVAIHKLDQNLLKWETSRNNEKFPHLYGQLNLDAVLEIKVIK